MDRRQEIIDLVMSVVNELNDELEAKIPVEEQGIEAPLYGRGGVLDSLGIVSLTVAVEQGMEDELDVTIALADDKAMSQKNSPFRTVRSLVDYVESLIQGER